MWGKKDQDDFDTAGPPPAEPARPDPGPSGGATTPPRQPSQSAAAKPGGAAVSRIGKTIRFKGEIHCDEDLMVDGLIEGLVNIPKSALVIGPNSKVRADVHARSLVLYGSVRGEVKVAERIEIKKSGCLEGSLETHRIIIEDGGIVRGQINVQLPEEPAAKAPKAKPPAQPRPESRPVAPPPPAGPAPAAAPQGGLPRQEPRSAG